MSGETAGEGALDMAMRRLERAVALLEQRISERLARAGESAGGLFDQDRLRLASELDAARVREKALEVAASEASMALAKAMGEIRDVLGER